jgi:N-methylhydantoinase A
MSYFIGVDTGGTFTDCVVIDEKGFMNVGKAPSSPPAFEMGILNSVEAVAISINKTLEDLLKETNLFVASSTSVTNTMLTRSGSKTGLITTEGFEDIIYIMRAIGRVVGLAEEEIKHMNATNKPEPLVPKNLIRGVKERIDYKGEVLRSLARDHAKQAIEDLINQGVESIAICLLWSFVNPVHERLIGEMIRQEYPNIFFTLSHQLAPRLGEYERTATTVINSYVGPVSANYLDSLDAKLKGMGFNKPLLIMQSYGGSLPSAIAAKTPVGMLNSGPAGGVMGSEFLADILGFKDVITTDVGGTSFDVGVIAKGRAFYAKEPSVNQYVLVTPTLEVKSIGAGGGSIAKIETETGVIKIGPDSAGAVPGPLCYNQGGTKPTLTDANLVLGFINPDYFIGGRLKLNSKIARAGIEDQIAKPLGITVEEAAASIREIATAYMLDLVRNVTVARGYDPSKFVMFVYGGAGPLHAIAYGKQANSIVIPYCSAGYSAFGCITSDVMHAYQLSDPMTFPFDINRFNSNLEKLENQAIEDLHADGFPDSHIVLKRFADMRYARQINEIRVPIPGEEMGLKEIQGVYDSFENSYEELYGKGAGYREAGILLESFYVEGIGRTHKPNLIKHAVKSINPTPALKGQRLCFLPNRRDFVKTKIYEFGKLEAGNRIPGVAIIETPLTTILVEDGYVASLDEYLNITLKREGS